MGADPRPEELGGTVLFGDRRPDLRQLVEGASRLLAEAGVHEPGLVQARIVNTVLGGALVYLSIWNIGSALAAVMIPSGQAAILGFTMPIWTVLLAAAFFGQPLSRRALVGMACAGSAVALLVAHEVTMLAGRPLGVLWMQLAAVSWALGTICLLYTSPSPRDGLLSRMPSSA